MHTPWSNHYYFVCMLPPNCSTKERNKVRKWNRVTWTHVRTRMMSREGIGNNYNPRYTELFISSCSLRIIIHSIGWIQSESRFFRWLLLPTVLSWRRRGKTTRIRSLHSIRKYSCYFFCYSFRSSPTPPCLYSGKVLPAFDVNSQTIVETESHTRNMSRGCARSIFFICYR